MDRRAFILRSGSTLAAVSTPVLTASAVVQAVIPQHPEKEVVHGFTQSDWVTIAAVQNHLFPSEIDAPGSLEINALRYLHDYLSNPGTEAENVKFILSGVHALQDHIRNNNSYQNTINFSDLSIEQREITLRQFEKDPEGRRWLVNILNYVLEALLTDPVYGGNPDGIGWQWLEHRAGEPRPPANKRYWLL